MSGTRSAIGIGIGGVPCARNRVHATARHSTTHAHALPLAATATATATDVLDKAPRPVLIMPALFAIRQSGMLRGEARPRCETRGRRWA